MNHVRKGLLLDSEHISDDETLFQSFQEAHLDSAAAYSQMSIEGERKNVVLTDLRNGRDVDLTAHDLDESVIAERMRVLKGWKKELLADDTAEPTTKRAYRWRVNEDIANLHMLQASHMGDMKNFRRWNEYIYGKPDENIFRAALDWVGHDAETILVKSEHSPVVIKAAERVHGLLEGQRGYRELLVPDIKTFEQVREDHMREGGYYALMLAGVSIPEGKVTNEEGDPLLEHILKHNLSSDYELGFSSSATWRVSHSKRQVERPRSYSMPAKRFVGLSIGHEIGSHILEYVNGMRGPFKLAGIGLDRYEKGNEGRATIREQVIYDSFDEFGKLVRWRDIIRRHIAVSYGYGVGQDSPRSSQELYQFMNAIDMMYQAKITPNNPEELMDKAHRKTGLLVTRVQRGVDGREGGAYLKDKVYLEGHVACWLTAAIDGSDSISNGDLGKFDINNPRHIVLLQQKKVLPSV